MTNRFDQKFIDQPIDEWCEDCFGNSGDSRPKTVTKPLRKDSRDSGNVRTDPKAYTQLPEQTNQTSKTDQETHYDSQSSRIEAASPFAANEISNDDQDGDLLPRPRLKPGENTGLCTGWGLRPFREGEDKLFFKIETWIKNGKTTTLERWYNVEILKNPNQGAGFKIKERSSYRREFISLFPEAENWRLDRFYPKYLVGLRLNVRVREVSHDMKRESIPEGARYSVIEKILSIVNED